VIWFKTISNMLVLNKSWEMGLLIQVGCYLFKQDALTNGDDLKYLKGEF